MFKKIKQRCHVTLELYERHTKLLQRVEEELCKDTVSCEHLIELLSIVAKEEKSPEINVTKGN